MKKFVSLFIGFLLTVTAFAQNTKSTYHSSFFDREKEIYMKFDGIFTCTIDVDGEYKSDEVSIDIKGRKTYDEFLAAMKAAKAKCEEWDKIAKENNITKLTKELPISFPRVIISWYTSEWHFQFSTAVTPAFLILESNGKSVFIIGGTATSSSNKYITQKYYFALDVNEMGDFIDAIDYDSLREKAIEKKKIEDLFQ